MVAALYPYMMAAFDHTFAAGNAKILVDVIILAHKKLPFILSLQ